MAAAPVPDDSQPPHLRDRVHLNAPHAFSDLSAVPEYKALTDLLRELSALRSVGGLLSWDEQVTMPVGSTAARARQKAALAGVVHEKATSPALDTAITRCASIVKQLPPRAAAVVRDSRRDFDHTSRISKRLAAAIAEAETRGIAAWERARSENDFASFVHQYEEGLRLAREYAVTTRPEMDPYSAAIDQYERGMTADRLQVIFDRVAPPLKDLLHRVAEAQDKLPEVRPSLRGGEGWDVDRQAKLCRKLAEHLGFNFERGRIDVSTHPFTGGAGPEDTRITTRYSTENPFEGIMGTVHEVGHGLYEQGRNPEYEGLPVSEPLSMGAHESQSLFWERMVAQSEPFWNAALPLFHEALPVTRDASAADFASAVNRVNPKGLIRVDADELSYPFHIIMRFEIERGLFDGSIKVTDLPAVWAEKVKKYFDVEVPSDVDGCLQDVHHASLAFGYFPSYTLGAMTAAQLYSYMDRDGRLDMTAAISRGKFADICVWLRDYFYTKGSLYPSLDELLISVTGEELNPDYFIAYLTKKYTKMYGLE